MKRFLAILSALIGAGIVVYSAYLMTIEIFTGDFLIRNLIFLAVGFLLLVLGFWGNRTVSKRNRSLTDEQCAKLKKQYKTATVVLVSVSAFVALFIAIPVLLQVKEGNNTDADLRQMMKKEYTQTGVPLPDNARYILYNVNTGKFESDSGTILNGISRNPEKVNVVVTYQITTSPIGVWQTASGATIGDAYEESMTLSIIRLSDWSLIEEKTISAVRSDNRLGKGNQQYTYQVSLYDSEVSGYLNGLFGK